jgi:hypothetical protein
MLPPSSGQVSSVPPEHWYNSTRLYVVTSQKIIFKVTTMETSNLTDIAFTHAFIST